MTNYLKDLSSCESLNLKDLTLTTVALSALVTAQSLHALNLDELSILDDKLVFTVADRTKTSRPRKSHRTKIEIPLFRQVKKLCPRTHVVHYVDKTRSLR